MQEIILPLLGFAVLFLGFMTICFFLLVTCTWLARRLNGIPTRFWDVAIFWRNYICTYGNLPPTR